MSGYTETGEERNGEVKGRWALEERVEPVAETPAKQPEPATEPAIPEPAIPEPAIDVPLAAALLVAVALGFGFWAMTHFSEQPGPAPSTATAGPADVPANVPAGLTAEGYVDLSARLYREKRFPESAEAALQAIRLKPDLAVAWNNRAASFCELGRWDEAVAAGRMAVQLKPDFELARNNLAWALAGKAGHK